MHERRTGGVAMRSAIIGFAAGAAFLQTQAVLPGVAVMSWAVGLSAVWLVLRQTVVKRGWPVTRTPRYRTLRATHALLVGAIVGFYWAAWLAHVALSLQLASADEGRDFTVIGTVDNLPYRFAQGVRFDFAVERVMDGRSGARTTMPGPPPVPPRIALSWYAGFRDQITEVGNVQPGERWQLKVRLQRPHGNANEYGFDYEAWLLEQGVRATGYVRPNNANRRLDSFVFSARNVIEHCRAALRARILAALPDKPYAGVIVALVVGDQRGIDHGSLQINSSLDYFVTF
jgi:competence protein ComEC